MNTIDTPTRPPSNATVPTGENMPVIYIRLRLPECELLAVFGCPAKNGKGLDILAALLAANLKLDGLSHGTIIPIGALNDGYLYFETAEPMKAVGAIRRTLEPHALWGFSLIYRYDPGETFCFPIHAARLPECKTPFDRQVFLAEMRDLALATQEKQKPYIEAWKKMRASEPPPLLPLIPPDDNPK
jgi:hypothetical protein